MSGIEKVAITGSRSIIGQLLVKKLARRGFKIISIDKADEEEQIAPAVELDLTDSAAVIAARPFDGCDAVVHLAGMEENGDIDAHREDLLATANVYEHAHKAGVKRFIFASTVQTQLYGFTQPRYDSPDFAGCLDKANLPGKMWRSVRLRDQFNPNSLFAISKIYGETLGRYYSGAGKSFQVVCLRIGWVSEDERQLMDFYINHPEHPLRDFWRSMWLSKRDCLGFFRGALGNHLQNDYTIAYAISRNKTRIFNLQDPMNCELYMPFDNSELFFEKIK